MTHIDKLLDTNTECSYLAVQERVVANFLDPLLIVGLSQQLLGGVFVRILGKIKSETLRKPG